MKTVIALQPEARQIGYAIFEGKELVEWGSKRIDSVPVERRAYVRALPFLRSLIERYEPDVILLPEPTAIPTTVRSRVIRAVRYELLRAPRQLLTISRHAIHIAFTPFLKAQRAGKESIMQVLVRWFPELKKLLPKPRRLWEPQDHWVSMFDAVALGITYLSRNE
jgi:hypothetical protein